MKPVIGRSRIVRRCSTTSRRKRLRRNGRSSTENVFGAAAISWTRLATCRTNAATPERKKNQKASVDILTLPRTQRFEQRTQREPLPLCPLSSFVSLSLFYRRYDRRDDLEEIPDDAVVGDLEDRRVGILVDRDDGVRAFHADQMLNGAGDAEREVQLPRDRLARAADLTLHRQPAGVADRTRRRDLGAERLGQLPGDVDVRLLLDAAAHRDDALGLRQIDRLLRLLKRRLPLLANRRRVHLHGERTHPRGRRGPRRPVDPA